LTSNTLAVRELVDGAIEQGFDIVAVLRFAPLFGGQGFFWPKKRILNGLPVYDVPTFGVRYFYSAFLTRLCLFFLGFRGCFNFAVCHQAFNFIAAHKVLRGRVREKYFVVHGSDLDRSQLPGCLRSADKVFSRSDALDRQLAERYGIETDGVLYSGIDAAEIIDLKNKKLSLSDGLVITVACLMLPRKNIQSCLRACKGLIESGIQVNMHLYGDGPLNQKITEYIELLDLEKVVHLHGFRPREEVLKAMRASHLFLMPSAPETFGLVYLEAMASGCVVVGHCGWGIDGVVQDGVNGYLVTAPTEVEAKVRSYVADRDREAMHYRSLSTAKAYTRDNAIANYQRLVGASSKHEKTSPTREHL